MPPVVAWEDGTPFDPNKPRRPEMPTMNQWDQAVMDAVRYGAAGVAHRPPAWRTELRAERAGGTDDAARGTAVVDTEPRNLTMDTLRRAREMFNADYEHQEMRAMADAARYMGIDFARVFLDEEIPHAATITATEALARADRLRAEELHLRDQERMRREMQRRRDLAYAEEYGNGYDTRDAFKKRSLMNLYRGRR